MICHDSAGMAGEGYYPQRDVCYVTATREHAQRRWGELHKNPTPDEGGWLPGDGMTIWAALVDSHPDDDFLNLLPSPDDDPTGVEGVDPHG